MIDLILLFLLILLIVLSVVIIALTLKSTSKVDYSDIVAKAFEKSDLQIKDEFQRSRKESANSLRTNREELSNNFKSFGDTLFKQIAGLSTMVDTKLRSIQEDNATKLEQMRKTVDEKLHETLEKRLGESFKMVSERLELVHKGLGEMQNLATGVGDLKKVLSNVKTRGVFGEVQLESILEEILTPSQYLKNVVTKAGSNMPVEFAVRIPNKDAGSKELLFPIDSKFPMDKYHTLIDAYESGDLSKIELASKELETAIKLNAKDIYTKYLDPPHTTEYAIMFLPVEGLYAEVARRNVLYESIRRDFKVMISGPTTLVATLSSFQMGFRALAIEKRTSEVWQTLGEVKTEFEKFGGVLEKAKLKINEAGREIDELVGTRTRVIQSKLKRVGELPSHEEPPKLPIS
ncbi:DNA recombination protein RmuC [candidate division WWE3 bacterium CG08_land_8_20_14_0_20_40_13]|uniref:DNA recombination protein RmuC n=1 Tax=candidate division WWE3 bacterium CG08_land_8_20_14_0_20_40_13 TaxID=1975084 RepID=A0A2H0XDR3_UNCKA|nr:MAG: DNA recombination protein RmuC [candidate division WWE3 bacterium CG08_land_8_20_14_0_20_40_13]